MRTKKTVVILVSGKAGAGKSTARDLLYSKLLMGTENLECMKYSFANPLKYMAQAFFGWSKEKDEKGRKLLQDIGKVGRNYDEHIWCKHLLNQLDRNREPFPPSFILIDDWRFKNEVQFFEDHPAFDVVTIRVFGRGGLEGENGNDVSETELPEVTYEVFENGKDYGIYDITIDNSYSIDKLESSIGVVLSVLKEKFIIEGEQNATT